VASEERPDTVEGCLDDVKRYEEERAEVRAGIGVRYSCLVLWATNHGGAAGKGASRRDAKDARRE
jgi:hypothetical protein